MSKRTRLWTPEDLAVKPVAWLHALNGAAHNAAGSIYAGAQPAAGYLPSVAVDAAGRAYLEGDAGHAGYIVAAGTETAFDDASGASVIAVHRLPSGLTANKAVIISAITDAEGSDAFSLRFGDEQPGAGGGGGIEFPDVAIAVQQARQYTLVVDS